MQNTHKIKINNLKQKFKKDFCEKSAIQNTYELLPNQQNSQTNKQTNENKTKQRLKINLNGIVLAWHK